MAGHRGRALGHGGLVQGVRGPGLGRPGGGGVRGAAVFARAFAPVLPGFSIGGLLAQSVASYLLGLAGVWVFGKVVQALAPRFGGTDEEAPAMKLAAYSPTAMWLAGVFVLVPPLSILALLGLYSLYRGTPVVTRVPEDRALVFTLALVACAVAVNILVVFLILPLLAF